MRDFTSALVIGIGATFVLDLWNAFLRSVFAVRSLDFCHLGRWIAHMPSGVFRHESIPAATRKPFECALGWLAHYSIGAFLAVVFIALAPAGWLIKPAIQPAVAFGAVTVLLPLLVLQPALGLGIAASRAPEPARARVKSLASHVVFGLGLYLTALALGMS